tara:strand:+ start:221 stop:1354 length:1134 start_codon:yes stop_codon:yes gene_type:complete
MPGFEIIDKREKKAVTNLFDKEGGVLFAHGYEKLRKKFHVREFENQISKKFKVRKTLLVSSGTAAIKIALKSIGIKSGDEVITQSFNFIATIEAIIDTGAKPIICDIDENLNMDLADLNKKITKKTKAIIPVHMLGQSVDIQNIIKIAKKKKLFIVEDNCETVGGKYKGKYLGGFGHMGILSFDFGKTITTGEGGAILTNNNKLYKICREYHDHGHRNSKKLTRGNDIRSRVGFNYRMTELQATVGKIQLSKLDFILKKNKQRYSELYKRISKKFHVRSEIKNSKGINDTFIFFVDQKKKREKIIKILKKYKIGTKNLPDALKWHCSYYWGHAIDKKQINNSVKSKNLLLKCISIPIFINKSLNIYKKLSEEISNLN